MIVFPKVMQSCQFQNSTPNSQLPTTHSPLTTHHSSLPTHHSNRYGLLLYACFKSSGTIDAGSINRLDSADWIAA